MLTPVPAPLMLHMLAKQASCTDPGVDHPCRDCRMSSYSEPRLNYCYVIVSSRVCWYACAYDRGPGSWFLDFDRTWPGVFQCINVTSKSKLCLVCAPDCGEDLGTSSPQFLRTRHHQSPPPSAHSTFSGAVSASSLCSTRTHGNAPVDHVRGTSACSGAAQHHAILRTACSGSYRTQSDA